MPLYAGCESFPGFGSAHDIVDLSGGRFNITTSDYIFSRTCNATVAKHDLCSKLAKPASRGSPETPGTARKAAQASMAAPAGKSRNAKMSKSAGGTSDAPLAFASNRPSAKRPRDPKADSRASRKRLSAARRAARLERPGERLTAP